MIVSKGTRFETNYQHRIECMDLYPNKEKLPRIIFVLSAFLFFGLVIILAKVIGDGPIVPLVFIVGWVCFMVVILKQFYKRRAKSTKIKKNKL